MLKALKKLELDYAMGDIKMLDWGLRSAILIKRIDEKRTAVADKALSLWLARGVQLGGWLREQPVEVITGAAGPCIDDYSAPLRKWWEIAPQSLYPLGMIGLANVNIGPFPVCPEGEQVNAIEWNIFFPSGTVCVRDSSVADAAEWLFMRMSYSNIWNYLRRMGPDAIKAFACDDLAKYNAKRRPVADAAEFLDRYKLVDHSFMRRWPETLHQLAELERGALNDYREKTADAVAEILVGGPL